MIAQAKIKIKKLQKDVVPAYRNKASMYPQ